MKIILYTGEVILCSKIEVSIFLVDEPKLIIDESYTILLADVHAIIDNKGGKR